MQKIIFSTITLMLSISLLAQSDDLTDSQKRLNNFSATKNHEVSLDVIAALAIPAFSPRYEYILGRYSGVGADLFIAFEDNLDFYEILSLTPYYRQYFFSKEDYGAKGFYAEGFMKFYTFDSDGQLFLSNGDSANYDKNYFETAIGAGIGWKWVSDSGFLVDLGIGVGRNLGLADEPEGFNPEVQVRGGLNFGWRF